MECSKKLFHKGDLPSAQSTWRTAKKKKKTQEVTIISTWTWWDTCKATGVKSDLDVHQPVLWRTRFLERSVILILLLLNNYAKSLRKTILYGTQKISIKFALDTQTPSVSIQIAVTVLALSLKSCFFGWMLQGLQNTQEGRQDVACAFSSPTSYTLPAATTN